MNPYFRSIINGEAPEVPREHAVDIHLVLEVHDHGVAPVAVALHQLVHKVHVVDLTVS